MHMPLATDCFSIFCSCHFLNKVQSMIGLFVLDFHHLQIPELLGTQTIISSLIAIPRMCGYFYDRGRLIKGPNDGVRG